jgi:hypothetical protein
MVPYQEETKLKLLEIFSTRRDELFGLSPAIIWLLVLVLVSGMAAFAEEARPGTSTVTKGPQFPSSDCLPKVTESEWSKLPLPSRRMLDDVLSKLKSVRVIDCVVDLLGRPCSGGYNQILKERSSGNVLFQSSDPGVLRELRECLRIREDGAGYSGAFTYGSPAIELTLVDGTVIYLGYIGKTIRWKEWRYDGDLLDPQRLGLWLTNHGITGPLREAQERIEYKRHEYEGVKASLAEFVRTMPTSLRSFFRTTPKQNLNNLSEKYEKLPEERILKLAKISLSRQYPKVPDQVGVLLEWDGKLSDSNHHFNVGDFPIKLLLEYDPDQILSKVQGSSMSSAQSVGASRYYSSYWFKQKFPSANKPLNRNLRQRIIRGVKATGKNGKDLENFEEALRNWSQP